MSKTVFRRAHELVVEAKDLRAAPIVSWGVDRARVSAVPNTFCGAFCSQAAVTDLVVPEGEPGDISLSYVTRIPLYKNLEVLPGAAEYFYPSEPDSVDTTVASLIAGHRRRRRQVDHGPELSRVGPTARDPAHALVSLINAALERTKVDGWLSWRT